MIRKKGIITQESLTWGVFGSLFALTFGAFLIGANHIDAFADTSIEDDVAISIQAVCTMSATGTTHSDSATPGQWKSEIGQTDITASCNDAGGYGVYAIGYTNSEYGNTGLVHTTDNTQVIATNTYKSGSTSAWSMKLGKGTGDTATIMGESSGDPEDFYTDYHVVPSVYTKVAEKTSATNPTIIGTAFTTTYGVFASSSQTAGTYTGKVKYTLVHPNDAPAPFVPQPVVTNPGYISYNTNAPTTETPDTMDDQAIADTDTSATLWASNFQRSGYGFAGWNTAPDYTGTSYGPNETISFTAGQYSGNNPGLSLYAMWIPSAGTLQDFTTTQCNTLTKANEATNILTQSLTALTDTRDNNTYAVARLADGNCWMIENLRLADKKQDNTPITLSTSNTNNPISTFTQLSASQDPTATAWCATDDSACDDQSMLFTGNTTNPVANMTSGDANIYSYGNYYNWYSATAGNGTYSTGAEVIAAGDICPNGWHLPYGSTGTGTKGGNTSGGFYYLGSALGATTSSAASSNIWRGYPQNFIYSGLVNGSSVSNRSLRGDYCSSTANSNSIVYSLYFNSRGVGSGSSMVNKYHGSMVRCTISGS